MEPPQFQEASRCDVCKCSFTTFRRRHHCRCCGRTLCAEHSSHQMALPQFGLPSPVRVCADCFNDFSRLNKDEGHAVANGTSAVTYSIARLDIDSIAESKPEPIVKQLSTQGVLECKCGMPLCICEAPAPPKDAVPAPSNNNSATIIRPNPKPKKPETTRSRGSTSNSKHSSIFTSGQSTSENLVVHYEASGEGLREAIKNGDAAAAKKLLNQDVDANYCDKQGSSLLHLAAVFNQTEIVFALMDHGANLDCRNSQGETPLDCAPVTLQYKMKKKIEESEQSRLTPTETFFRCSQLAASPYVKS